MTDCTENIDIFTVFVNIKSINYEVLDISEFKVATTC